MGVVGSFGEEKRVLELIEKEFASLVKDKRSCPGKINLFGIIKRTSELNWLAVKWNKLRW